MAASQGNSPKHYMIISGILVILTLLFMILFRLEDSKNSTEENEQDVKLFYMLPSLETSNPNVLSQARKDNLDLRELAARDSFDDPTIMSFPNKKYGFSLERNDRDEPPETYVEKYNLPLIPVDAPVSERVPLVGIFPDPSGNDTGNLSLPSIGEVEIEEEKNLKPDRIIWMENDKEIRSPLKIEDVKKAAGEKIPSARTVVKIEKLNTSPVLFLTGKSGIDTLDKLVIEHLRSKLVKVFTGELKASDLPDTVSVDWRLILR